MVGMPTTLFIWSRGISVGMSNLDANVLASDCCCPATGQWHKARIDHFCG